MDQKQPGQRKIPAVQPGRSSDDENDDSDDERDDFEPTRFGETQTSLHKESSSYSPSEVSLNTYAADMQFEEHPSLMLNPYRECPFDVDHTKDLFPIFGKFLDAPLDHFTETLQDPYSCDDIGDVGDKFVTFDIPLPLAPVLSKLGEVTARTRQTEKLSTPAPRVQRTISFKPSQNAPPRSECETNPRNCQSTKVVYLRTNSFLMMFDTLLADMFNSKTEYIDMGTSREGGDWSIETYFDESYHEATETNRIFSREDSFWHTVDITEEGDEGSQMDTEPTEVLTDISAPLAPETTADITGEQGESTHLAEEDRAEEDFHSFPMPKMKEPQINYSSDLVEGSQAHIGILDPKHTHRPGEICCEYELQPVPLRSSAPEDAAMEMSPPMATQNEEFSSIEALESFAEIRFSMLDSKEETLLEKASNNMTQTIEIPTGELSRQLFTEDPTAGSSILSPTLTADLSTQLDSDVEAQSQESGLPNWQNDTDEVDSKPLERTEMEILVIRLCSFLYCPSAGALSALRLANAGFYYTGRDGVVACYSCDLRCRDDDARLQGDPYAFHREMNRHCPHMNNKDQSHLFIQDHQSREYSGRDITGSPSNETQRESELGMTETARREAVDETADFLRYPDNTETSEPESASLPHPVDHHGPQNSATDVSARRITSTSPEEQAILIVSASPSAANNTSQDDETSLQPGQVESAKSPEARDHAPSAPAFDQNHAVDRRYADVGTWEHSFIGRWPDIHVPSPKDLAVADFFYAGVRRTDIATLNNRCDAQAQSPGELTGADSSNEEPSPTSQQTPPADSSLQPGMKCFDGSYHEETEVDRTIATEDSFWHEKDREQHQTVDITEESDEGFQRDTEPTEVVLTDISAPLAPETAADITGEQGGSTHLEEEDSTMEGFRGSSMPNVEEPQRNTSLDRLEGSQPHIEVACLEQRLENCSEYMFQANSQRNSASEHAATDISPPMASQNEEFLSIETPERFVGEFFGMLEARGEVTSDNASDGRRQTRARLPESSGDHGPRAADEDNVSLVQSQRNIPLQHQENRHLIFLNIHKVPASQEEPSDANAKKSEVPLKKSSKRHDCHNQSAAEPREITSSETSHLKEGSDVMDEPRNTHHLVYLPHALWKPPFRHFCTIILRPFFPIWQNGPDEVDFSSPERTAMNIEGFRLCTFLYCPSAEALPALRLANAGFYYTGRDGVVGCYSCGLRCRHDDARLQRDPYAFHREMNQHCPHLNSTNQSHLFIQDHQSRAYSGRDITGSPSEETQRENVQGMTETARRETVNAFADFLIRIAAALRDNTETSEPGSAALPRPDDHHGPQRSAADVSARCTSFTSSEEQDPNHGVPRQHADVGTRERSVDQWSDTHAQSPEEPAVTGSFYAADPANQNQGPEVQLEINPSALPPALHSGNPAQVELRGPSGLAAWERPLAEREQPVPTSSSLDQLGAVGGVELSAAASVSASRTPTAFRPAHQPLAAAGSPHRDPATLPAPTTQPPIPGPENDDSVENTSQGASARQIQHGNAEVDSSQGAEGRSCTAQSSQDAFLQQLRCAVCLTDIVDHVFVPCGHLICEICSSRFDDDNRCHICRTRINERVRFRLATEQASNERNSELAVDNYFGYAIHPSAFRIVVRSQQPTSDEVQAILLEQGTWREPMHPHMRTVQARLQTLLAQHAQVPPFLLPILQEYAEAGFFLMRPDSDELICYHCGNGIREWTGGPWAAHAQFFPNCGHLHDWI